MGEVIQFPKHGFKVEVEESASADENLQWLIDNTELISFEGIEESLADLDKIESAYIQSCYDYQMFIKKYLTREDYEAVVLGIMDPEYYAELEEGLQKIVDTYYSYETI